MKKYLFFDLDGTVINSEDGIFNAVEYAIRKMGFKPQKRSELLHYIGPPLARTFSSDYNLDAETAMQTVNAYREYYSVKGIFECRLYDGVKEMLEKLHESHTLVLATCKPTVMATRILEHFALSDLFTLISGPELDGTRGEKDEVVAYAMEKLAIKNPSDVLMIGDRRDDVCGAKKCGIESAGVLWGFGTREELTTAGADYLLATPQDAVQKIGGM